MEFGKRVGGIEPLTFKDYPNKMAAILFYIGCNAHCPYCYNTDIVKGKIDFKDGKEVQSFLKNRVGKLDAVVFSGGECTIWDELLIGDIRFAKNLGYLVKLDTNGTNPNLLKYLIKEKLIDFISLDFKCLPSDTNVFFKDVTAYNNFLESLNILLTENIEFEVRTTVHRDVIDEHKLSEMCALLVERGYDKTYYIQQFFEGDNIEYLDSSLDRHPTKIDVNLIDSHGLNIEVRNS